MRTTDGRLYVGAADGGQMVPITGEVRMSYEDDHLCDALSTPAFPTHEASMTFDALDFDSFSEKLCALGTVFHTTTSEINALALRMEMVHTYPYRHKYVWQYRNERKGSKKSRRKPTYNVRYDIPNARVRKEGDGRQWNIWSESVS